MKLQNIVHIQHNIDGQFHRYPQWWQTHYFVEFDVLNRGQLYRSSVFVHKLPNNDICFMSDYAWKGNARINLLTPVGNQISWLEYMAEMLEEILKKTSEKNVNDISLGKYLKAQCKKLLSIQQTFLFVFRSIGL